MKPRFAHSFATIITLLVGIIVGYGCSQSTQQGDNSANATDVTATVAAKVQRFGSVIGLKPEKKDEYVKLHAECWPEILDMIGKCNIQNYSIYMAELKGNLYLFSYFEYTGTDFEADMQKMKDDQKTNEWWALTDPCQIRLEGTPDGEQWLSIPEVFHTD